MNNRINGKISLGLVVFMLGVITNCTNSDIKSKASEQTRTSNQANSDDSLIQEKRVKVFKLLDTVGLLQLLRNNAFVRPTQEFTIKRVTKLDTGTIVLIEGNSNTCSRTYLLLMANNEIKKCAEIEEECDDDLSRAIYEYKNILEISDTLFKVIKVKQTVVDPNKIDNNGHLKNHISRDDVEIKNDTSYFLIGPSFMLTNQVPSWPKIWE